MTPFIKPSLLAGLCVGCLALSGGAQPPTPQPVPPPPPPTDPSNLPTPTAAPPIFTQAAPATTSSLRVAPRATTVSGDRMIYAYGFGPSDGEALKLARQIADAKGDTDKDKLRDKMSDVLDKAFEERQKRHEQEIAALEAQVKRIKEMVAKRKENKKEIISERVKQLEREATGLGW